MSVSLYAQFGPGGVGNVSNNGLWLKADDLANLNDNDPVNSWPDFSGNNNDAENNELNEQPEYIENSPINGRPALLFNGVLDQLMIQDHPLLDNSSGITFYTVIRPNNLDGEPRGILGKRITQNVNVEYAYTFFFWPGNELNLDIHTQNDRFSSGFSFSNNNNFMPGFIFDGSLPTAERSKIYNSGNLLQTGSESSTSLPNSSQVLCLGGLNQDYVNGGDKRLGAYYSEVVQFNYALNTAERIIVENYLGAKYGLAINNSFYNYAGTHAGEVAGIGRVDANNLHDDSQGSAIVRINNPSSLADGDFLIWGHDEVNMNLNNLQDVDGNLIEVRLDRVWRATHTGDVGTVDVTFDLSSFSPLDPSDVRLLIDRNGSGFFDNDVTPQTGNISGTDITFEDVDLHDGDFFTVGSINYNTTPLPIELKSFEANKNGETSVLNWVTSSELNNDYFTIERSEDGKEFLELDRVKGAGNSTNELNYSTVDENPFNGINYYRLKQTDYDGTSTYSDIRSVNHQKYDPSLKIYPNPSEGKFAIAISGVEHGSYNLQVLDASGRLVYQEELKDLKSDKKNIFNLNLSLESGSYIIQLMNKNTRLNEKILIR